MTVAGIVLAAGRSTRLTGEPAGWPAADPAPDASPSKLLLPFGRHTVVAATVRAALAGGLEPVAVVVGHRAAEVREALEAAALAGDHRVLIVDNPGHAAGPGTSLAAGARALEGGADVRAVAVLLADEPGVRPESIRAVVAGWRRSGADVARALYRDRPGHPVVFGRPMFGKLQVLPDDRGAAALLDSGRHEVCGVRLDCAAPVDVDTERDYREALRRRQAGEAP